MSRQGREHRRYHVASKYGYDVESNSGRLPPSLSVRANCPVLAAASQLAPDKVLAGFETLAAPFGIAVPKRPGPPGTSVVRSRDKASVGCSANTG